MNRIRKHFNWLSVQEIEIVLKDSEKIKIFAKELSVKHEKEEKKKKIKLDSTCPNCKATAIVNKIARVEGSGSVSGSFGFGGGYIGGSSSIDTSEVNHCNSCGNQWKKYAEKWDSKNDVLADWINFLWFDFQDGGPWLSTYDKLKEFHAESIWNIRNEVYGDCLMSARENLTLSMLRTKFKSVYDKK